MGSQAFDGARGQYFLLNPEDLTLVTDEKHYLYSPRVALPINQGMVDSIKAFGVQEAIFVKKDGDKTLVVNGRQRVKNALEANKQLRADGKELVKIKAIVLKGTDAFLSGVMILTDELRQNDRPVAKAEKISRYMAMGRTEEEAAVVLGITPQGVKQLLSLLNCAPQVQHAVADGSLSVTAASQLAKLSRDEQTEKLESLLAEAGTKPEGKRKGKVTVKAARKAAGAKDGAPTKSEVRALFESGMLGNADSLDALKWVLTGEREGVIATGLKKLEAKSEAA